MTVPETQPMTGTPAPELHSSEQACRSCGAPLSSDQRYCLNCGHRRAETRLPFMDMVEADAQAAQAAGRVPPGAIPVSPAPAERSPLIALTSLIALLLALGIGVLIGRGSGAAERVARAPVVNVTGAGTGANAQAAVTSDWPAGTTGFTVQLQLLPATASAADVAAAKHAAAGKGAADTGALRGDEYPSVGAQGFVVYSGVFTTRKEAQAALKGLTSDFPGAKVVEVSTSAKAGTAGAGGSVTKDPQAKTLPKSSGKLSPQEYQKRSKKLPDKVQSQGKPPPKDKKAPGGGSSATVIG